MATTLSAMRGSVASGVEAQMLTEAGHCASHACETFDVNRAPMIFCACACDRCVFARRLREALATTLGRRPTGADWANASGFLAALALAGAPLATGPSYAALDHAALTVATMVYRAVPSCCNDPRCDGTGRDRETRKPIIPTRR